MNHYRIIDNDYTESSPTESLVIQEIKDWTRVTFNDDDTLITELITASRKAIENFISVSIVEKDAIVIADLKFINNRVCFIEFELPYGPVDLDTIVVKYKNGNKSTDFEIKTFDDDYYVEGILYPVIKLQVPGIYRFEYTTGYETVPEDLKHAIKAEIAYRYEHRGDALNELPKCATSRQLAKPYKRYQWL